MVTSSVVIILLYFGLQFRRGLVNDSKGWRAVPAIEAVYSARRQLAVQELEENRDELLPRTSIHSIYKFGFCSAGSSSKQYLRKSSIVHFATRESTVADYVYLIEPKHTVRYRLQCVLLRIMVPRRYLFRRSRLPLYYCQGTAFYVMFDFIQRLDIHEFFLHFTLNMPADFHYEFYHPKEL